MSKKEDKRKVTAKENLKKAREAKLRKLKEEKKNIEYEVVESSDDESSSSTDDEVIVVKGKKNPRANQSLAAEVAQMKEMLNKLSQKQKKERKKKVIKVLPPKNTPPISDSKSSEIEAVKKRILLNL